MQELLRLGLPAEHDVGSLCVCARSWDKGITWLCLDVSMPSATDVGELTHDYCAPCVCLCVPRRGGCINIVRCPQRHTGRLARGGPRRRRSSWLEKISDKGLILKAFSLCVQGLHRRIGGLWPSAMSACRRDYARVQHRRATTVRAAQISQILDGKSANLSQIDVSRRTQWRGLPQHLAGTVRPSMSGRSVPANSPPPPVASSTDWLHQRQPSLVRTS